MAKNFLSFFTSQRIEELNSPLNGKVEVSEFLGKPRIIVDNLLQSGGLIGPIWEKGINKILRNYGPTYVGPEIKKLRVLILGLGGGTSAQLISQYFSNAKIIGVEIDPIMIKLGRKYFGLGKIKNLKIIINDAINFCFKTSQKKRAKGTLEELASKYDLILVDLYLGAQFPKLAESINFFNSLKKLLPQKGFLIFNRLFWAQHRKSTQKFIKKLDKIFSKIELLRAWSNLLVVCQP